MDDACAFCDEIAPASVSEAIERGWTPFFWVDEDTPATSGACAHCASLYLLTVDKIPMVKEGICCPWPRETTAS